MAKQQRSIRQTHVVGKAGKGQQLEHTEVFDDSLLPDASEIQRLKELDPDIIDWLKERASAEQEFRHSTVKKRMEIVQKAEKGARTVNYYGMTLAFLILTMGIVFSYFLLQKGHEITGSIFGGATLIFGAQLFINNRGNVKKITPNNPTQK